MSQLSIRKKALISSGALITVCVPIAAGWLTASTAAAQVTDYQPIVKVAPEYPTEAARSGLEGYVILEFTVTDTGAVANPVVIESSDAIFEQASIDAALKFKYQPRAINGQPVATPYVRNKITYVLAPPETSAPSRAEASAAD